VPLRFELVTDLVFYGCGRGIADRIERCVGYRPELDDIVLLMRLAVAYGDEGRLGTRCRTRTFMWEAWRQYGCVVSGGLLAEERRGRRTIGNYELISDNKWYESTRRWIRKRTRLV
jgi:hypothetical protein